MIMNKKALFVVSLIFVSIWITSCYKDKFDFSKLSTDMNWNPNLAVPAVHSSLTIRDLLNDYDSNEVFVQDQTGFLYLMYHKQVFSLPASDYVTLPDQTFSDNFTGTEFITQGFPASSPKTITKNYTHQMSIGLPTDAFDSLILKDGTFTLSVTSTFLHTGSLIITFPTMKLNGVPYSKTVNINTSNGSFTYSSPFTDLAGYKIDLTNPTFNQIPVNLSLTLVKTTGNIVSPSDQANVSISFSGLKYSMLWGNIGQRTIPMQEDTVNIKFFNNTINGSIYFMDPKFRLYLYNSFGVPMSASFNDFKIYSSITGSFNTYTFPAAYNPLVITAPTVPAWPVIPQIVQLDTLNFSPIRSIISEFPRYVYLQTTATTNPTSIPPQYNFIMDTSRFSLDLEVELPMWGRATWWVLQDTIDFNLADYYKDSVPDLNNIDWVKFHINVTNGMPTEAGIQMYLCDTNYVIKGLIFPSPNMEIVQSGVLGQSGRVVSPTRKISDFTYQGDSLKYMLDVRKILVRGYVHTTNVGTTNVRFYDDYAIDVKVGVQVQTKFNTGTDF